MSKNKTAIVNELHLFQVWCKLFSKQYFDSVIFNWSFSVGGMLSKSARFFLNLLFINFFMFFEFF